MMRRSFNINKNWIFEFPGKPSEEISLPHTFNNYDECAKGDYYRGSATYIKKFVKPDFDEENEKIFLEFDGVGTECTVFVNDNKVGSHEGGFTRFRFEITGSLVDGENILKVEVSNASNPKIIPTIADYVIYGGIYRDVNIIIVNKRHFYLKYFGGSGLYILPFVDGPSIKEPDKPVANKASIRLSGLTSSNDCDCNYYIYSKEGQLVKEFSAKANEQLEITLENIHLWNGVMDPYTYTCKVDLVYQGQVVDTIFNTFGLRSYYLNPSKGFYLNGQLYQLRCISRHQDYKGFGNALTRNQLSEDMALIKDIGANGIRLAFYQQDPFFYDLCDKEGMVVWSEIPYTKKHSSEIHNNAILQLKELLVQNAQHPSIIAWGLSNDITDETTDWNDAYSLHKEINDLCHFIDYTRPTVLVSSSKKVFGVKLLTVPDIVYLNMNYGFSRIGYLYNFLRVMIISKIFNNRYICFINCDESGSQLVHNDVNQRHDGSEETQAYSHELSMKYLENMGAPVVYAGFIFDYADAVSSDSYEPGVNHSGLVSFDRTMKKDAYYLYKAYWSQKPMIHICSKTFESRKGNNMILKVYSNCDEIRIYQNGQFIASGLDHNVYEFPVKLTGNDHFEVRSSDVSDEANFSYIPI